MVKRLGAYRTPNTEAEVLTAVTGTWEHVGTIQLQAVRIFAIVRSRRPIEAVRPSIAGRRAIEVARIKEVVRIGP